MQQCFSQKLVSVKYIVSADFTMDFPSNNCDVFSLQTPCEIVY